MTLPEDERPDHARARELAKVDRDRRVDEVVTDMAAGAWSTKRARDLAQEWGIGLNTVRDYAREASSILRRAWTDEDREALRGQAVFNAERLYSEAMARVRVLPTGERVPDPDLKAGVAALRLVAEMQALITNRHEVTASPSTMSEAEIHARLEALGWINVADLTDEALALRGLVRLRPMLIRNSGDPP